MFLEEVIKSYPFINAFTSEQWQYARHNTPNGSPLELAPDVDIYAMLEGYGMSAQDAQTAIMALNWIAVARRPYVEYENNCVMKFGYRTYNVYTKSFVDKKIVISGSVKRAKLWSPELSGKRIYL